MTVLLLTQDLDPTADMVVRALNEAGTPVVRMDPGDLPHRIQMDARFEGGTWRGTLRDAHRCVDLADVSAVYNRRPRQPQVQVPGLLPQDADWAANECYEGFYGVLYSLPVLWLNRPDHNRTASLKALQLSVAQAHGLMVPQTLVTNTPSAAREFAAQAPAVCKTLRGVPQRDADTAPDPVDRHPSRTLLERLRRWVRRSRDRLHRPPGQVGPPPGGQPGAGAQLISYTWQVPPDEVDETVSNSLCQFQRLIVPAYEVRLIAVGMTLFAARIDSPCGQDGEITDWRAYQRSPLISYTPIEVPAAIREGVLGYLGTLHLTYGAFDFMVDAQGRWHFLECNPNGQFAFVEYGTGQPIARTVADLLSRAEAEHAASRRRLLID